MVDNTTKKRLASPSTERNDTKKMRRPIVSTKASQARANAIRTAQKTAATAASPSKPPRKKQTAEPPSLAKSYHTTASSLKQRPAWDLRGKVTDITEMYKLSLERLEELRGFKRELEVIKEDKESQEKEALEQAQALRTELHNLERTHMNNIEELHAKQRIEFQKLEDDNLNFSRRQATRDIEVDDAKRKLEAFSSELDQVKQENSKLKETFENLSSLFKEAESEKHQLNSKLHRADMSIVDHEKEIQGLKEKIESVSGTVNTLQSKLSESHQIRDRLLNKVKDLEEAKKDKSAKRLSI